MSIKEIKEKLAKLATHKEKLDFLEKTLKLTKDSEEKKFIIDEIAKLKFDLEGNDAEEISISERELSRIVSSFEPEIQPIRQNVRQQRSLDSTVSSLGFNQREEEQQQSVYGANLNDIYRQPAMQQQSSTYLTSSDLILDIRDKFIREGILPQDREPSVEQRNVLHSTLRSNFPGITEEALIRYEADLINSKSFTNLYQKKKV